MSSQSDLWKHFGNEFQQLAREQERPGMTRRNRRERTMMLGADWLLYASVTYKKHPEILGERGKPEQGAFCLIKTPKCGLWIVGGSVSENLQERFRALAWRAGVALTERFQRAQTGSPKDIDPEEFWLHRLFLDLRENNSDHLFAESDEGGSILHVCEASATFCSRLEGCSLGARRSAKDSLLACVEKPEERCGSRGGPRRSAFRIALPGRAQLDRWRGD